jgi:nicotinate-nucleotide pyrophosphorylase (carboxylating)
MELEVPRHVVVDAVTRALAEDLDPLGDLSAALVPRHRHAAGTIGARRPGVLAGSACAIEAFRQVDPAVSVRWLAHDGDRLEAGQVVAAIEGRLASILTAERTALNFLGHLSGIATLTARYVDLAAGRVRVWDTRKTIPGLRTLEKAAVRAGGGHNHRGNLSEWVMLKDNHLTGTTITEAVARAHERYPGRTVHVECERLDQVHEALEARAEAILLDNMTPDDVRACVAALDAHEAATGRRPLVEASGGIDLTTIDAYAATGVDLVSVGALTNSAPVLDLGLDIHPTD